MNLQLPLTLTCTGTSIKTVKEISIWGRFNVLNFCKFIRAKVTDEEHGQHGWIHLRQSIHNPNIAVNVQSMVPRGCQSIIKSLRDKYGSIFFFFVFQRFNLINVIY